MRARIDAFLPAGILRRGVTGRNRRANALLPTISFRSPRRLAVLDGVDAAHDRVPHALGCGCVRDDRTAAVVGGLDDAPRFLERESRTRLAVRPPAIVRVDLDQIDTVRDLAARHAHDTVESIGFLCALRHVHFRREALRRVAAGDDHRRAGHEHARAGDDAFVDRLPESPPTRRLRAGRARW
jgi:hypothetical protein